MDLSKEEIMGNIQRLSSQLKSTTRLKQWRRLARKSRPMSACLMRMKMYSRREIKALLAGLTDPFLLEKILRHSHG